MKFYKFNIIKKKIKHIDEDLFCNYIRSDKQSKLIKLITKNKIVVNKLDLNWDYISEKDNLKNKFIHFFKVHINFSKLSINKNLTIEHIKQFKHSLDWISLSKTFDFSLHELQLFEKFIRWEYIFFYNNNASNEYKIFFKKKMWWLFQDDNLSIDINTKYHVYNNKILNKNINNVSNEMVNVFNQKIQEYNTNLSTIKLILKKQLFDLYKSVDYNGKVIELDKINCINLYKGINKYINVEESIIEILDD